MAFWRFGALALWHISVLALWHISVLALWQEEGVISCLDTHNIG